MPLAELADLSTFPLVSPDLAHPSPFSIMGERFPFLHHIKLLGKSGRDGITCLLLTLLWIYSKNVAV